MGSEGESERGWGIGENVREDEAWGRRPGQLIFDFSKGAFAPGLADAECVREWRLWDRLASQGERERGWGVRERGREVGE